MKSIIENPEDTERKLLEAGFRVDLDEERFVVYLQNRKVSRSEVAEVLGCEAEDLSFCSQGVLVA